MGAPGREGRGALPFHPGDLPRDPLDPGRPTGLLFACMGGPDGPEAVAPFLRNLFLDPAVLPLPRPLARVLGPWIARRRAPAVREKYRALGFDGGSPQLSWTRLQCKDLERALARRGILALAAPAMRYWHPFPREAVEGLRRKGADQFLVVPAYPHWAAAVSGNALFAVVDAMKACAPRAPVHVLSCWHRLPGYVEALARRAEAVLGPWHREGRPPRSCACVFSAHALPLSFVKRGDPYVCQVEETTEAVRHALAGLLKARAPGGEAWLRNTAGGEGPVLAFQSRVGPLRWTGPGLRETVVRLGRAGCRNLLVLPLSFTCEHIETLHELDREIAEKARTAGVEEFRRAEALNLDPTWIESLADHLAAAAFYGEGGGEEARHG